MNKLIIEANRFRLAAVGLLALGALYGISHLH